MRFIHSTIHISELEAAKNVFQEADHHSWLDFYTPSQAFLACVGSGPWKYARRKNVIDAALNWLDETSLHLKDFEPIYPLQWQNNMLKSVIDFCKESDYEFDLNILLQKQNFEEDWYTFNKQFFDMCGSKKGAKVLWLFLRDYMQFPAFPIDRHVERRLKEAGLPLDPWRLIDICHMLEMNPCLVAKYMVQDKVINPSIV